MVSKHLRARFGVARCTKGARCATCTWTDVQALSAPQVGNARDDAPAHRQPFAFTVHVLGSDGQLKSGGSVVGASGDSLLRGSPLRETMVALCRMFHAHVVEPDVQGE
jgi:hypothetical protein